MKIQGTKYETVKGAMKGEVERRGGAEAVKSAYDDPLMSSERKITRMLWNLWGVAERSLLYGDDHPGFALGWVRVCPQVPGWNIYTDGVCDTHIFTALKKIGTELGLMS